MHRGSLEITLTVTFNELFLGKKLFLIAKRIRKLFCFEAFEKFKKFSILENLVALCLQHEIRPVKYKFFSFHDYGIFVEK